MATADSNAFSVVIAPPVLPTYTGSGSAALGASIAASGNGTYVAPTLPTYTGSGAAALSASLVATGAGTFATTGTAISFVGTFDNQTLYLGVPYSADLSLYFTGSFTPFTYAVATGSLPPGITLNTSTGLLSGTPTGVVGSYPNLTFRGTDTELNTAVSTPAVTWTVAEAPAFGGGIFQGTNPITKIFRGATPIVSVWQGALQVWPSYPAGEYDALVSSLGAIDYYKMGEPSGNLQPTIGSVALSRVDGGSGFPAYGQTPHFGFSETSIRYNGSNAHTGLGGGQTTTAYSVSVCVNITGGTLGQSAIGGREASSTAWEELVGYAGLTSPALAVISAGLNLRAVTGTSINYPADIHLVIGFDNASNAINVNINGVASTGTDTNMIVQGHNRFNIGKPNDANSNYEEGIRGTVSHIAYYPRLLTPAEMQSLWNAVPK